MTWSNRYVGIPFTELGRSLEGCDCWGLACVIYREELGITLPEYLGYASTEEQGEIAELVADATSSPLWVPVEGPALAFDIAGFRRGRFASHAGIVIRHGLMIHQTRGDCAKVEAIRGGLASRLAGTWRHVMMISGAKS